MRYLLSYFRAFTLKSENKYLILRNEIYWYQRKIPVGLVDVLGKTFNRQSLKTKDLNIAQKRRDMMALADNDYWADLKLGRDRGSADEVYSRILMRAQSLSLHYKTANEMVDGFELEKLLNRIEILEQNGYVKSNITVKATLGLAEKPKHKISEALRIYIDKIKAVELSENYNPQQLRHWLNGRNRAVNSFIAICGDMISLTLAVSTQGRSMSIFKPVLPVTTPQLCFRRVLPIGSLVICMCYLRNIASFMVMRWCRTRLGYCDLKNVKRASGRILSWSGYKS